MATLDIVVSLVDDPMEEDFPLRVRKTANADVGRPTLDQTDPLNVTGAVFAASIVPSSGAVVPVTVTVIDSVNTTIRLYLTNAQFKGLFGKVCRYFVSMTKDGITTRLWTANFTVKNKAQQ